MRRIDTSYLWLQEASAEKKLQFGKVSGALNPADGLTKYVSQEQIRRYAGLTHCEFPDGANSFGYTIGSGSLVLGITMMDPGFSSLSGMSMVIVHSTALASVVTHSAKDLLLASLTSSAPVDNITRVGYTASTFDVQRAGDPSISVQQGDS